MSMAATKKPKAADRTIDMFTGTSKVERVAAAAEDVQSEAREPFEGIDSEVDRWREQAFQCQDWTTKNFYQEDREKNQADSASSAFRLTLKKGWLYLEKVSFVSTENVSVGAEKEPYSYAGLMMPQKDLFLLMEAILKACWTQSKENVRQMFKEVCK